MPDFTQPTNFLLTSLFIFLGISLRYFGIALLFSLLFGKIFKTKFQHRIVNTRARRTGQNAKEIAWSLQSAAIFTAITMCIIVAFQLGFTRIYSDFSAHSYTYFFLSILGVLLIHETYYYWLHRLMHHPKVYKYVHKAHHDSITTSAYTSFSFHPIESLLQAIIIPVLTLILPLHLYAIGCVTLIMTITSVINHLNIELYPKKMHTHWLGKWFIGATHHSLHHSQYLYNYGLYFTFWDKIMHTESEKYHELFEQKTTKKA